MTHAHKKAYQSMSIMKATLQYDVGHCILVHSQSSLGLIISDHWNHATASITITYERKCEFE